MARSEITMDIKKHIGVIGESKSGWTKEINYISWNGMPPKYDIRDWAPNREKMGKGVTLNEEELVKLSEILKEVAP